jgi:hypothetical protein
MIMQLMYILINQKTTTRLNWNNYSYNYNPLCKLNKYRIRKTGGIQTMEWNLWVNCWMKNQ